MTTTMYWTLEHIRQASREMGFRASCWWLSQQVECLHWRLYLELLLRGAHAGSVPDRHRRAMARHRSRGTESYAGSNEGSAGTLA